MKLKVFIILLVILATIVACAVGPEGVASSSRTDGPDTEYEVILTRGATRIIRFNNFEEEFGMIKLKARWEFESSGWQKHNNVVWVTPTIMWER